VLLWICVCLYCLSQAQAVEDGEDVADAQQVDHSHHDHHDHAEMNAAAAASEGDGEILSAYDRHAKCGMANGFYLGYTKVNILFDGVQVNTPEEMVLACFVCCLAAIFYEFLKIGRQYLLGMKRKSVKSSAKAPESNGTVMKETCCTTGDSKQALCCDDEAVENQSACSLIFSFSHLLQTVLQMVQMVLSQLLMLIFMTYNGYLCIAVALGSGLGYFLFYWKKGMVTENCH